MNIYVYVIWDIFEKVHRFSKSSLNLFLTILVLRIGRIIPLRNTRNIQPFLLSPFPQWAPNRDALSSQKCSGSLMDSGQFDGMQGVFKSVKDIMQEVTFFDLFRLCTAPRMLKIWTEKEVLSTSAWTKKYWKTVNWLKKQYSKEGKSTKFKSWSNWKIILATWLYWL